MTEIIDSKYHSLLQDLAAIQAEARKRLEQAAHLILSEGYWNMGKRLFQENLNEGQKMDAFARLSKDMGIEQSLFSRMLKFYDLWQNECPAKYFPELTWSHFKLLLAVDSNEARAFYLKEAQSSQWQVRLLSQKIKDNAYLALLTSSKNPSMAPALERRQNNLHIYKATVNYVVDGDTLVIDIDLGFDVWVKKRLRLRGIDTPELKSDDPDEARKAQKAKAFVEKRTPTGTVIVMQSFMVDLHGRFVADVFYAKDISDKEKIFTDGNFLNQELLDAKLAEII